MNIRLVEPFELETLLSVTRQTFVDTYEHLNDPVDFQAYLSQNFTLEKLESDFKTVQNDQNTAGGSVNNYYFIETDKIIGYFKINVNKSPLESDTPIIYQLNFDYKINSKNVINIRNWGFVGSRYAVGYLKKISRPDDLSEREMIGDTM